MNSTSRLLTARNPIEDRAAEIFEEQQRQLACQTDHIFAVLMIVQWAAAVIWAALASPQTWSGADSSLHPHVLMAIVLGGLTASLPVYLAWKHPGERKTRYVIAVAQVLFSSLLIHVSGGRIETHFHIFGSLAFLAAYRDWRVLVPATLVVAVDHFVRGAFWPETVFGVATASSWRWLEHAAWVLFEDLFLFVIIRKSVEEMQALAEQTATIEEQRAALQHRTEELDRAVKSERAIVEGSLDGVVQMDLGGRVIGWNSKAVEIFGWTMEEAIGQHLAALIVPEKFRDAHNRGLEHFRKTGAGPAVNQRLELEGLHKNGKLFPLELSITPVYGGPETTFCAFVRDITDRTNAEQELRDALVRAEAANEAKSSFLANVSHEIRTPLNGILGFADLLIRKGKLDDGSRENVLTIKECGEHLLCLINDILDLSKIEAGRIEVTPVRCSPFEIVAAVVSVLRVKAQEKGITLEYHWSGEIPESIVSDPARIKQLLINLVSNAVKFTAKGGVWIEAFYNKATSDLTFSVRDSGIGIPSDKLEAIFDPFVQVDNSVTRSFEGTGLGLAICRRIARNMGGDVTVESTVGHGSTFSVTVNTPAADGSLWKRGTSADVLRARPVEVEPDFSALKGLRVLVVEDGETNRRLICAFLDDCGISSDCAENGAEGVQMASQFSYNAILMDMQMPVMDGYTAARRLRSMKIHTPIIALTAHAMEGDAQKCYDAGCSDYLSKPVRADLLTQKIAQVTGSLLAAGEEHDDEPATPLPPRPRMQSTLPMDKPRFREIVLQFIERLDSELDEMESALREKDFERLSERAHWLRGTGGTAGFDAFTRPAQTLENSARQENGDQALNVLRQIREISELIERPEPLPV